MNIGETDADGWTYVRFGDAAKAAQEGTHEVEGRSLGYAWAGGCHFIPEWEYRVRKKARTITVTHAKPIYTSVCKQEDGVSAVVQLFEKHAEAQAAHDSIRAAMEQS